MEGLGLAFIDLMVLVTEGRGGRFERTPDGRLAYRTSGAEPILNATSPRGVPYLPKPVAARTTDPRQALIATPAAWIGVLQPLDGQPGDTARQQVAEAAWGLLHAEMAAGWYGELLGDPLRAAAEVRCLPGTPTWDDERTAALAGLSRDLVPFQAPARQPAGPGSNPPTAGRANTCGRSSTSSAESSDTHTRGSTAAWCTPAWPWARSWSGEGPVHAGDRAAPQRHVVLRPVRDLRAAPGPGGATARPGGGGPDPAARPVVPADQRRSVEVRRSGTVAGLRRALGTRRTVARARRSRYRAGDRSADRGGTGTAQGRAIDLPTSHARRDPAATPIRGRRLRDSRSSRRPPPARRQRTLLRGERHHRRSDRPSGIVERRTRGESPAGLAG